MRRDNRFTVLCSDEELLMLEKIAKYLQRSRGDTIRVLIQEKAQKIQGDLPETNKNRVVYFMQRTVTDKRTGQYVPCIAVEGERGYHRTDWQWGHDYEQAEKWCEERNMHMGITPQEALDIVLGTMRKE